MNRTTILFADHHTLRCCQSQRGVVLIVALVVLLAMTSIGVTIMSGSTLQERMAGNNRQLAIARSNAERALREAENWIHGQGIHSDHDFAGNKAIYWDVSKAKSTTSSLALDLYDRSSWSNSSLQSTAVTSVNGGKKDSQYVVEFIGQKRKFDDIDKSAEVNQLSNTALMFRITAIGYGQNEKISAVLTSVYTPGQL